MLINLGYKYRLKVSKSQKQLLLNHIFAHNQAWNILLNESNKQFEAERIMRKEIKKVLDQEQIKIPYPQIEVHNNGK